VLTGSTASFWDQGLFIYRYGCCRYTGGGGRSGARAPPCHGGRVGGGGGVGRPKHSLRRKRHVDDDCSRPLCAGVTRNPYPLYEELREVKRRRHYIPELGFGFVLRYEDGPRSFARAQALVSDLSRWTWDSVSTNQEKPDPPALRESPRETDDQPMLETTSGRGALLNHAHRTGSPRQQPPSSG